MSRIFLSICALCVIAGAMAAETERIDLGNGVVLEAVLISGGRVNMGSPATEAGRGPDEEQHEVRIDGDFLIGKFPVTRAQFARFVAETGYRTEAETGTSGGYGFDGSKLVQRKEFNWRNPGFAQTDTHPVVIITYDDAQAFLRWLAKKSGRKCSLPSEAQWEYACRAGTTTRFYNGDADTDAERIAWFKRNAEDGTRPVGEKEANAFGLYDMSGNVYEWCQDMYAPYVPGGGVQGPMDKPRRVLRGGSWIKDVSHVRSAARARNAPGSRNADNGFRVVLSTAKSAVVAEPKRNEFTPPPAEVERHEPLRDHFSTARTENDPPEHQSTSSGGVFLIGVFALGLIVVVALIFAWIIYSIVKRSNNPSSRAQFTDGHREPRLVEDGFWFDTDGYNAGDVVSYSYRGPQGTITKDFVVEPSSRGQFIYTGISPEALIIGEMLAQEQIRQAQAPRNRPQPRQDNDDDTFRGYPSAY